MSLTNLMETSAYNPLDNVERMATTRDWAFDRSSDDEVTLVVAGEWAEYQLSFTWMSEIEALHLACAFDLKVPALRRAEVIELVTKINEQMWIGHFDFWEKDGLIMFRHALVLAGGTTATDISAKPCSGPRCRPASAISKPSSSSSGPARRPARRFRRACSRPAAGRKQEG